MQLKHVPSLGAKYWTSLVLASVSGANTGDFFADRLGLGHLADLPVLAGLLAIVLAAEWFDNLRHFAPSSIDLSP